MKKGFVVTFLTMMSLVMLVGCANVDTLAQDINKAFESMAKTAEDANTQIAGAKSAAEIKTALESVATSISNEWIAVEKKHGNAMGTDAQAEELQKKIEGSFDKFETAYTKMMELVTSLTNYSAEEQASINESFAKVEGSLMLLSEE